MSARPPDSGKEISAGFWESAPLYGGKINYKDHPAITIPPDISLFSFSADFSPKVGEYIVVIGFLHRTGAHHTVRFPVKKEEHILVITDKHLQAAQVAGHNPF